MYAVIREGSFRPGAWEAGRAAREEFNAIRAQLPGFRGLVMLDAGDGRLVQLALWESEQAAAASVETLRPHRERLVEPLLSGPPRVLFQGPVVEDDLTAR